MKEAMGTPVKFVAAFLVAVAMMVASAPSQAEEKVKFILNWVPGADHAPYFFARAQGWYEEAGLEVKIEPGKGSAMSSQRVGVGTNDLGIAELGTALVAKSKGADLVAVMNIYANSPFAIYWLKSSGIRGPKDFVGKTIGNPPWDAARVMWPAFAKAVGIEPDSVKFVNISPQAKMTALAAGSIDITTDFYNGHDVKVKAFGDDLGFVRWSEIGVNPYGNSIIVNGDFLKNNRDVVARFVAVTQRAFAACVADSAPCIGALLDATSGLDIENQTENWNRVKELMTDEFTTTVALGYLDPGRMQSDYELVDTYFELEEPFDINTAFTNEFLDKTIKMPPKGS